MKPSRVLLWLSLTAFGLAVGSLVTFNLIGSTIGSDGMLQEPFFLLPLFWLFLFGGLIMALSSLAVYVAARVRR